MSKEEILEQALKNGDAFIMALSVGCALDANLTNTNSGETDKLELPANVNQTMFFVVLKTAPKIDAGLYRYT